MHNYFQVSVITFHFWFGLGELLYQKHDDAISSLFKPFVSRLFVALTRQVQMEPDHVSKNCLYQIEIHYCSVGHRLIGFSYPVFFFH